MREAAAARTLSARLPRLFLSPTPPLTMALDPKSAARDLIQRPGVRIGVAISRFHEDLTGAMLRSAEAELRAAGMEEDGLRVVWVPGAFELPIVARRLARREDVDAVLCFGLVLTGETTHDHWVAMGATQGITQAALETDTPIHFGVLTCQNLDQAKARALPSEEGGVEDKGREVARAALVTLAALDQASAGAGDGRPAGF